MLFVASGMGLWCSGCIPTGGKTGLTPRPQAFESLDSAFSFMLYRDRVPETAENISVARESCRTSAREILGKHFIIVLFDCVRPGFPLYATNRPCYILLEKAGKYALVGEFLGSRVDLLELDGNAVARVYWHFSASKTPHSDYPFDGGRFNYLDPRARGDRFK